MRFTSKIEAKKKYKNCCHSWRIQVLQFFFCFRMFGNMKPLQHSAILSLVEMREESKKNEN